MVENPDNCPRVRAIVANRGIALSWVASGDAFSFSVARAPGRSGRKPSTLYSGPARRFTDTRLTGGVTYRYTVTAYDRAGNGAARVIRTDPEDNALLMNFLGWVGAGRFTTAEVLDLADLLHVADPSGHDFGSVSRNLDRRVAWARERFDEAGLERERADLDLAERVLAELLYAADEPVLLHGDLQPKNLIVSAHGLTAVDPMPAVGPALFDVALWIVKSNDHRPLAERQAEILRLRTAPDADALQRWSWSLAVLESRPYLGRNNRGRETFINDFRNQIAG